MKKFLTILSIILVLYGFAWCSDRCSRNEAEDNQKAYQKALDNHDYETARQMADKIWTWHREEKEREITDKELNYLISLGTPDADRQVVLLLNELAPNEVRSDGALLNENTPHCTMKDLFSIDSTYRDYVNDCAEYNNRCVKTLNIVINLDRKSLAREIIKIIKPDPDIKAVKKDNKGDRYEVYAHYTDVSKEKAIKLYSEHFGSWE